MFQKKQRIEDKKLIAEIKKQPCIACGTLMNIDVHHMTTVARGGDDVVSNLAPLCRTHHTLFHSRGVLGMVVQFPGVLAWLKKHDRLEVVENAKNKTKKN